MSLRRQDRRYKVVVITRQYVTIAEAIVITGLSYSTIGRRIQDGALSKIVWSGKVLIPVKELMPEEACLKSR